MKSFFLAALRFAVGAAFVLSGMTKLIAPPGEFLFAVQSYRLLPGPAAAALAATLPWAELFLGAYLALGLWTIASAGALLFFNAVFMTALSLAQARGVPLDRCGCFGEAVSLPPGQMLLVDAFMGCSLCLILLSAQAGQRGLLDRLLAPQMSTHVTKR